MDGTEGGVGEIWRERQDMLRHMHAHTHPNTAKRTDVRDRQMQTVRETDMQTERDRQTYRQRERPTCKKTCRQRERQTCRQICRHRERDKRADRQKMEGDWERTLEIWFGGLNVICGAWRGLAPLC